MLKLKLWHFSWVTFWVVFFERKPSTFSSMNWLSKVGIQLHSILLYNASNVFSDHMAIEYLINSKNSSILFCYRCFFLIGKCILVHWKCYMVKRGLKSSAFFWKPAMSPLLNHKRCMSVALKVRIYWLTSIWRILLVKVAVR